MSQNIFDKRLKFVDSIISLAKKEKDIKQKIYLLENINYYMTNNHCGVFRYEPIEELLQEIGKEFAVDNQVNIVKKSFLHIMTRTFTTGGHTKLVENFLINRTEYLDEIHNVVILYQYDNVFPIFIEELNNKNRLHNLSKLDIFEKINKLAELSLKYENIILHHNMYDTIPVLALSQFKNKKNIIIYNHADHLYWVGSSIVSHSLEMSSDGLNFSNSHRNIKNNYLLPIPLSNKQKLNFDLKKILEIKESQKIVLSIGHQHRYEVSKGDYSFREMVKEVLKIDKNIIFIIVGNHNENFWQDLWEHKNIRFVGLINREEIDKYYSIADIYVDSFPMGGGTATLDAITFGIPSIKVKHIFFEFDSLKPYLVEKEKVSEKIIELFSSDIKNTNSTLVHLKEQWNKLFDDILVQIKKNESQKRKDNIVDEYSLNLHKYQLSFEKKLINNSFIKLSIKNKIYYLWNLILLENNFLILLKTILTKLKEKIYA